MSDKSDKRSLVKGGKLDGVEESARVACEATKIGELNTVSLEAKHF